MTEFKSRRELREAERQGLIPKPEVVFDLPTGQISLPNQDVVAEAAQDLPSASEMLTRKRIREMERLGLLDPLTGAVAVNAETTSTENIDESAAPSRAYDEVLAETEEPITASINAIAAPPMAAADCSSSGRSYRHLSQHGGRFERSQASRWAHPWNHSRSFGRRRRCSVYAWYLQVKIRIS
ncbi:MAG: hypothetical protein RL529_1126 [Actinomycetota bacterium]